MASVFTGGTLPGAGRAAKSPRFGAFALGALGLALVWAELPRATAAVNTFPNTGFAGIGTLTPSSQLTIYDPTVPQLELRNNAGLTYMGKVTWPWSGLTSPFILQANSSGDMVITPVLNSPASGIVIKQNGNVGIGNIAPAARLDVGGTIKATAFSGNGSGLTGVAPSGIASGDLAGSYPNPTVANGVVTSAKLASDAASLNKVTGGLVNVAGGNVGIGTTSPSSDLTIYDSVEPRLEMNNGTGLIYFGKVRNSWFGLSSPCILQGNSSGDMVITPVLNSPASGIVIKQNGNVGIGTLNPTCKLEVNGRVCATSLLITSDRHAKTNFLAVDRRDVLRHVAALPLWTWQYTNAPGVRHIGPMAQDFKAAFPALGVDDTHIATVDADGVALAAIQALLELVQEKETRLAALEAKLATEAQSFADRLAALEKAMSKSGVQQATFRSGAAR